MENRALAVTLILDGLIHKKSFWVRVCILLSNGTQLTVSVVVSGPGAAVHYRLLFHKNHHTCTCTMCATNSIWL